MLTWITMLIQKNETAGIVLLVTAVMWLLYLILHCNTCCNATISDGCDFSFACADVNKHTADASCVGKK